MHKFSIGRRQFAFGAAAAATTALLPGEYPVRRLLAETAQWAGKVCWRKRRVPPWPSFRPPRRPRWR